MTTPRDIIISQLASADHVMNKMTADLSESEFFVPAMKGGNHAGWILGHIAVSEDSMVTGLLGKEKRYPKEHELFKGGAPCHPEASKYPSKTKIEELLRNARAHTLEALKQSDESKWDQPSPEGWPKNRFPTLASVWALIGAHPFWHIGQLSMCRHAMNKKRVLE
ncbi:MAG: DinB family protein [Planctomycetes bacterium]|nr:DinB family protein [Planctomycetota bacterium]